MVQEDTKSENGYRSNLAPRRQFQYKDAEGTQETHNPWGSQQASPWTAEVEHK